jgi:NIMA-interacting peptidyl-prolyl cis-trans isomerase 1
MVAATASAVDMPSTDDLNAITNTSQDPSAAVPDDVVQAVADAALQQASTTDAETHLTPDANGVGVGVGTGTGVDGVTDNAMPVVMDNANANATNAALPPTPLPNGWILKESRSQPDHYYYFHYESGVTSWQPPPPPETGAVNGGASASASASAAVAAAVVAAVVTPAQPKQVRESEASYLASVAGAGAGAAAVANANANAAEESAVHQKKRSSDAVTGGTTVNSSRSPKRPSVEASSAGQSVSDSASQSAPTKVRVLHILKKHKDSRRASSWRQAVCTATRDEAAAELTGLLELLQSEEPGPDQQATFEELARTESDCSSAKRGGDLGYFGRKKMQPAFEAAAFGLQVGEMSEMIDTNSGVHVLLRIG